MLFAFLKLVPHSNQSFATALHRFRPRSPKNSRISGTTKKAKPVSPPHRLVQTGSSTVLESPLQASLPGLEILHV